MAQRPRIIWRLSSCAQLGYRLIQEPMPKGKKKIFSFFRSGIHTNSEGYQVLLKEEKKKSDDCSVTFVESGRDDHQDGLVNAQGKAIGGLHMDRDSFCPYLTKRKTALKFFPYHVKEYQEGMLYKQSDGSEKAFLYSTKIKKCQYSDRISSNLYVSCFSAGDDGGRVCRKSLFDILFRKFSLLYLFTDTSHVHEVKKYLADFARQKGEHGKHTPHTHHQISIIEDGKFLKLRDRQQPIELYYCYVSPYRYLLSTYFSKKIAQDLKANYFNGNNFFFINDRLRTDVEDTLLLPGSRTVSSFTPHDTLPSLLLVDDFCYVRYHIKGLFTREASHYLYNVMKGI
ncbi:conserved Plasmodium protein, unknown function [Plasmodium knowlesi strain H]|uniref:Uncharacterized protein n=3 Tax=Plasmodium knowlesi TaxID=5850 RepID=A0A5K1VIL6_PLAKH|nr:conserved Plasmodium protein, unknown function [Plasmodium knowlesi strain H]OTN63918.1 Uncharacterized protein PKNOH_S140270300 [Plasmodium knowlesi]CAA9991116.1 conserved Plasmodium protein, unknown function [Plasmodium knowlesi strain H]SBO20572.1 conserved Plasmodium protein, unknown function [Plasmodium knowlesi strain H]SBO20965.1 conserved Plasmodium protein, unknown function [Plasmodium knowlesi strain H]VVS80590.1 conserved Plasmodium protein, unknown function [Plasmodium knowlesi |eukprot:XP_002262400.1 hypothetical protein, conserved in Plasmodium species [Plasmodium knowlesi strain H]